MMAIMIMQKKNKREKKEEEKHGTTSPKKKQRKKERSSNLSRHSRNGKTKSTAVAAVIGEAPIDNNTISKHLRTTKNQKDTITSLHNQLHYNNTIADKAKAEKRSSDEATKEKKSYNNIPL